MRKGGQENAGNAAGNASARTTQRKKGKRRAAKIVFETEDQRQDETMTRPKTLSCRTNPRKVYAMMDTNHAVVREGDIVVAGSDGLFDNVPKEDIVSVVATHQDASLNRIAHILAKKSLAGKKRDDITVTVMQVVRDLAVPL